MSPALLDAPARRRSPDSLADTGSIVPPPHGSTIPPEVALVSDKAAPAADAAAARETSRNTKQRELEIIYDSFARPNLSWKTVDWRVLLWMIAMHVGALAAPFFFTWEALGAAVVMHWLTASIGICLTYHRYLSHRSLKVRQPVEFFMLLCGVLSGEGGPLMWSAVHRLHHKRSDQPGDPHSPLDGPWWSHITWLFLKRTGESKQLLYERFIPELTQRPLLRYFDRTFNLWLFGSGVAMFLVGGLPLLLWGLCMRMVIAYHSTWFVNSATHIWGYRNYTTRDESRNLWWVAVLSYGEGWHNNHHAHPSSARAGHQWWEFDPTFWVIRALRATGMAYDVRDRIPLKEAGAETKAAPESDAEIACCELPAQTAVALGRAG